MEPKKEILILLQQELADYSQKRCFVWPINLAIMHTSLKCLIKKFEKMFAGLF